MKVEDLKEKADSIISRYNFEFSSELKDSELLVKTEYDLNEKLKEDAVKRTIELLPIIKKVNFVKE